MKKSLLLIVLVCVGCIVWSGAVQAASLSHVYDFTDQGWDAVDGVTFEGLTFTDDGTLWITSAPNFGTAQLFSVNLEEMEVLSQTEYSNAVEGDLFWGYTSPFNPVALASDGTDLFVGSNGKTSWFNNYVYTTDGTGVLNDDPTKVTGSVCNDPEGAAYLGGAVYLTCQDSGKIIKLNDDGTVEDVLSGVTALGLAATETSLIIGDYKNHDLVIYDVATGSETERIDLEELFPDYSVQVAGEDFPRTVPDPDGLAYRDGKIYMTFEHDLRVFEIELDPPAVPEPGTLLLLGIGLLGIAKLRKKRS